MSALRDYKCLSWRNGVGLIRVQSKQNWNWLPWEKTLFYWHMGGLQVGWLEMCMTWAQQEMIDETISVISFLVSFRLLINSYKNFHYKQCDCMPPHEEKELFHSNFPHQLWPPPALQIVMKASHAARKDYLHCCIFTQPLSMSRLDLCSEAVFWANEGC